MISNFPTGANVLMDVPADKLCRRTNCVGGQIVSADKLCRRTNCVGGQIVSADKLCRRTNCVGGEANLR